MTQQYYGVFRRGRGRKVAFVEADGKEVNSEELALVELPGASRADYAESPHGEPVRVTLSGRLAAIFGRGRGGKR